jgi:hypothetical protein
MHAEGRHEGGYRCANAKEYECWNRTTCVGLQAHEAILAAVCGAITSLADCREQLVARVLELHASGNDFAAERRSLQSEEARLNSGIEQLLSAIEGCGGESAALARRLAEREQELRVVQSRLAELTSRAQDRRPPPSADDILRHLDSLQAGLSAGDRRAGVILRQLLDGPIRAVPYQQFGSDKVVLRAEFNVVLARALPEAVAGSIEGDPEAPRTDLRIERRQMLVDLFTPSGLARHAVEAHELAETGLSLRKVGEALGISKRLAHTCSQLGAAMAEAGMTDPFVRLSERPDRVSRWRPRRSQGGPGDRRAG